MGNRLTGFKLFSANSAPPHLNDLRNLPAEPVESAPAEPQLNPGPVEDIHRMFQNIVPNIFEGARLIVNNNLSNHFQVSHIINLNSESTSGYRFGATYMGKKRMSPFETFPVLKGDIDPAGNLNATIIHQLTPKLSCKINSKFEDQKLITGLISTGYTGHRFTASFTVADPNIFKGSAILVGQFLGAVTENLSLGCEVAHERNSSYPGGHATILSGAARYVTNLGTLAASAGFEGSQLSYYQKANDWLQVGVMFEVKPTKGETLCTVGYQVEPPEQDFILRAMVNSKGTVAALLEKKLLPLPCAFVLSGCVDHDTKKLALGCGLTIN